MRQSSLEANQQFGDFLKNPDFVEMIDAMARRYGRLPSELLREQSISDYNLNVAVMVAAMSLDAKRRKQNQKGGGMDSGRKRKMSFEELGFKVKKGEG